MEACTDSVVTLLPHILPVHQSEAAENKASTSRKRRRALEANGGVQRKGREKRKEMSESFDVLQSLVPNLSPKATRETIVSETIQFIEDLQKQLMRLEMEKKPLESVTMLPSTNSDSPGGGVIVSVSSNIVLFGIIFASVRRGMVTQILMAFERHQAEVLAANVAVSHGNLTLTVTASVHGYVENTIEQIRNDILSLKK
ncbi:Transcription factor bHLH95 [Cucurbita argyrosperma subsp. argyrosperma]